MALTIEDVLNAIRPVILLIKERNSGRRKQRKAVKKILGINDDGYERPEYPEYWEGYGIAAEWVDQIRPHAQIGYFPERLFAKRAPNEKPEETHYIKENYQQITLDVFKDYVEVNGRATHSNNWNIEYAQDEEQYISQQLTLQDFIENKIPIHNSLENFTFQFLPPLKYMDGMGVVVIKPEYLPTEEINGELVISQTQLIDPFPRFFHTTKVIHYSDELAVIEWDEYSDVTVGDITKREGIVYYAFTKDVIYRIYQVGKKEDFEFVSEVFWQHNIGMVAVKRVDGVAVQINETILQMSPFMYSVPTLNDILIDSCMLRGIKAMCTYPYRIMVGDPCDFQTKVDGEIIPCIDGYLNIHGERRICTQCNGKGMKDRVSPYGTLLIKKDGNTERGDGIDPTKAMYYAAPSTETPKFIREEVEHGFTKAYNSLHIQRSESNNNTGAKEVTATEDLGRQKALIASITTNTMQLFDLFEWEVEVIGKMRYAERFKKPKITRPSNLDVFVESDDLKKINDAIKAQQPPFVIQTLIFNYLRKLYYNDLESRLVFDLIVMTDRLLIQSSDDINSGLQRGNVESWEKILHDSAITFINQLRFENPDFLQLDPKIQVEALIKKAKDKAAEAAIVTGAVPTGAQRINSILQG